MQETSNSNKSRYKLCYYNRPGPWITPSQFNLCIWRFSFVFDSDDIVVSMENMLQEKHTLIKVDTNCVTITLLVNEFYPITVLIYGYDDFHLCLIVIVLSMENMLQACRKHHTVTKVDANCVTITLLPGRWITPYYSPNLCMWWFPPVFVFLCADSIDRTLCDTAYIFIITDIVCFYIRLSY